MKMAQKEVGFKNNTPLHLGHSYQKLTTHQYTIQQILR